MRVSVPKDSTGRLSDAWRHCVGTGRFELALRRDDQDSLALVRREIVEITAVTDETPPWWDEDRLLGTGKDEA